VKKTLKLSLLTMFLAASAMAEDSTIGTHQYGGTTDYNSGGNQYGGSTDYNSGGNQYGGTTDYNSGGNQYGGTIDSGKGRTYGTHPGYGNNGGNQYSGSVRKHNHNYYYDYDYDRYYPIHPRKCYIKVRYWDWYSGSYYYRYEKCRKYWR
jgi:hypothetical protein